tara:strand:- start:141 stop:590 length:450 start_codon:yes stop_codon:yes gene_type:complete
LLEAGTRVPFITYWKGTIKPAFSDAIVCQMDLLASLASLTGTSENITDSKDLLNAFLGESDKGRENLLIEANSKTALRSGDWLMIPPYKGRGFNNKVNIDLGVLPKPQLYNVKEDVGQQNNLADTNREKLAELIQIYESLKGEKIKEVK